MADVSYVFITYDYTGVRKKVKGVFIFFIEIPAIWVQDRTGCRRGSGIESSAVNCPIRRRGGIALFPCIPGGSDPAKTGGIRGECAVRVPPTVAEPFMDAAPVRAASPPEPRQEAP